MLPHSPPFPAVGSWALLEVDGVTHAVRIILKDPRGRCTIAMPRHIGASGNRTVDLADLRDPTPLTADELREIEELGRKVREGEKGTKRSERLRALQLRRIDAELCHQLRRQRPPLPADLLGAAA